MTWYDNASLQTKFALHVVLSTAFIFAVLLPLVLYIQKQALLSAVEADGFRLAEIFARSSVPAVVADDYLIMQHVVNGISSDRKVRYAMLLREDGLVLVHTRANERGKRYEDAASRLAAGTREPLLQRHAAGDGAPVYDFAVPVYVLAERRASARVGLSLEREEAEITRTRNYIALLGVAVLAFGLVWAAYQARRVVRPVQELVQGTQEIARGNLGHRIPVRRGDELGQLALAFNRMTESVQALNEQVRRHAEELETTVALRTRELREANRQLETASHHKSEFLANMSHELRTPLNAIMGFSRLVMQRSRDVLPPKQYENMEKILISAEQLLALISDILDLSKVEAGRMEIRPVSFDLGPLVETCLRTVEPMMRSDRIHLVTEVAADLPRLYTDPDKLKQILINLLSNAIKFTEAGTITARARRLDGGVAIAVADSGIGIPEDALEAVFEEFRQVDSSPTRKYGGTGLGLSISRHFARLLGGDITVQSAPGAGSTFTVTIPFRYPTGPPAPRPPADAPGEEEGALPKTSKTVLAIDDDPDVIYLLRENLTESGYRVVGALNGEDGHRKARDLQPFAITLDIMMPHKDGWEVLHKLKADPATKDIPIIVVSIVDNQDLGYRLGAFDYLVKPFDREAIVAALGRIPRREGRLLVVDDDPQVVDLVRQYLEGEPYEVGAAEDGAQALEAIARQRPDVILLDLLMPRMDGFAVIEHLQQDPRAWPIPVIVLTAKTLTLAERAVLDQSVLKVVQKMGLDREGFIQDLRRALQAYRDREPSAGS